MLDGSASSVMESASSGYATPFAIALNASTSQIGFLAGISVLLGSLAQPIGATLAERVDRKKVIVSTVMLQALVWLPIAAIPFFIAPGNDATTAFIALFALMVVFGSISAPVWNSAMADIIPLKERGAFFGRRKELLQAVTLATLFAFGLFLGVVPKDMVFWGFAAIFAIAFAARMISAHYLNITYYPPYHHRKGSGSINAFVSGLLTTDFGKLALFLAAIVFATNIAAPFFQVYLLRSLGYTYQLYAVMIAINAIAAILTFSYWGRLSDAFGNKKILFATGLLVPLVPLAYLLASSPLHIAIAEAVSGIAWAGFNLATFNYVLEFSPSYNRARYIAYYNVLIGLATFGGALLGSFLIESNFILAGLAGIPLLFALSTAARFLCIIAILPAVADSKPLPGLDNRRFFVNAVINYPMNEVHSSVVSGWSSMVAVEKKAVEKTKRFFGEFGKHAHHGGKAFKRRFYLEE